MIRHYVSNAFRAVRRDLGYSTINITGLAVGMACCLLILIYILDERSYDQFHEKSDRIVRLALETKGGDGDWRGRVPTFYQLADMVDGNLSGVEETVRIAEDRAMIATDNQRFMEENLILAGREIFDVFSISFLQGDPETAFQNPFSIVLTENTARRYFGNQDPLGKILTSDNQYDYEVTGVVREMRANSHFHFDLLMNLESTHEMYNSEMFQSLGAQWIYTYVLMESAEPADGIAARINAMMQQYIPPDVPVEVRLVAQPLTDIHLYSQFESELEPNGNIRYLYLFAAIAIFILIIACVNFMNLATARASVRAREVGVRKLLGAHRNQLVRQFLAESTGLSMLAVVLALVLSVLALPIFNSVTGKAASVASLLGPEILLSLVGIALIVGILAGSYPAFFLSAFRPARVLKGSLVAGRSGAAYRFRQGLVVFQFGISIAIILGTFVVFRQLDYMQHTDPGFDRDQVLTVRLQGSIPSETLASLKEAFSLIPGVARISSASHAPPDGLNSMRVRPMGASPDNNELISWIAVDHEYVETLGLEVVAGRDFSEAYPGDSEASIVINEAMVRFYNLEEPVGSRFELETSHFADGGATVVGVVKDFQQTSLHEPIRPVYFYLDAYTRHILVKLDAGRMIETIPALEQAWSTIVTDWPFEFSFLDDQFNALYQAEQRLGRVFRIFALLAVFVACMGLFGLSAYMTERRNREIGVRKVFGASLAGLVGLLTREFLVLVSLAYLIAVPLTWMGMKEWMNEFAYQATIGVEVFLSTALLSLVIATATVSYQAIRAAVMNPVETLRYD